MEYIIPGLLVLLGVVNLNLVRVALKTGAIQSRLLKITRDTAPTGFWSALVFQLLISVLCFVAAGFRFAKLFGVELV